MAHPVLNKFKRYALPVPSGEAQANPEEPLDGVHDEELDDEEGGRVLHLDDIKRESRVGGKVQNVLDAGGAECPGCCHFGRATH